MKSLLNPSRVSGLVLFGIGLILLSQTFGLEGDFFDDGIHPFSYPRILISVLLVLSALIVLTAKSKAGTAAFPIFNPRSVGIGVVVLLYAALFSTVGFMLSSFTASVACGVIMGWGGSLKRLFILALVNAFIIGLIWLLFWRALKIPLPAGTIW